ncbi:MAG: MerR family transcriptional regulator [Bulleidia sp.]
MKKADLKKLTGLSDSSLYYYENHGLIQPARTSLNYREYSNRDIFRILSVQKTMKLGLSIEQFTQAVTCNDFDLYYRLMHQAMVQKKEEVRQLNRQIRYLESYFDSDIMEDPVFDEYRITELKKVRYQESEISEKNHFPCFEQMQVDEWKKFSDSMNLTYLIREEDISDNELKGKWYCLIDDFLAESYKDPFLDSLPVSKPCRALTCWVKVDKNSETDMVEQLKECVKYARDYKYDITGRIGAQLFLLASDYAYFRVGVELKDD